MSGRLFVLLLERSRAAREDALASIRRLPTGWYAARIGGKMRGRIREFPARVGAVTAVNEHYNAALMRRLNRG